MPKIIGRIVGDFVRLVDSRGTHTEFDWSEDPK